MFVSFLVFIHHKNLDDEAQATNMPTWTRKHCFAYAYLAGPSMHPCSPDPATTPHWPVAGSTTRICINHVHADWVSDSQTQGKLCKLVGLYIDHANTSLEKQVLVPLNRPCATRFTASHIAYPSIIFQPQRRHQC